MSPESRSNEEIREDLRRAASTATGFCHDAAKRLADDFESLSHRLAAVERERDDLRADVKIRDVEITRQHPHAETCEPDPTNGASIVPGLVERVQWAGRQIDEALADSRVEGAAAAWLRTIKRSLFL